MHYNEILSIDKQKELYTSLIDYFTEDDEKLIIKPHPADTIDDYEKMFKGSIVLTKSMPSELFPYCIDHNFEKGITCWSTSIFGLQKLLKKIINFDTRIDKTYEDFDLYYAITMYLKKIKKETKRSIKMIDINEIQLLQMLKYYFKDYEDYYNIVEVEKADKK